MGPQNLKYTQAYVDGINDFVDSLAFLPMQFLITGTAWEKWKLEDTLACF